MTMIFHIRMLVTLLIALSNFTPISTDDHTVVNTPSGPIRGFKTTNKQTQLPVYEFRGIRYGKPPMGPLRFKKPLPVDPWTDIFNATEFGAACPQLLPGFSDFTPKKMSEDCLFLNVYVPGDVDPGKQLPVMVWIHGGGLSIGWAHQYDGGWIATEGNVIMVTINYRLGVFGFLATNHDVARGNYGLWDQKLALEWVQKNIGAFGGNTSSVTVFGQSAGAWSASFLSLIPSNQGLFHRVICQSGVVGRTLLLKREQINMIIKEISDKVMCPIGDMETFISCVRKLSMMEILNATHFDFAKLPNDKLQFEEKYLPVVDGELFIDHPIRQLQDKTSEVSKFFGSLDFIAGHTSNDGALLYQSMGPTIQQYYAFNPVKSIPVRVILNGMAYPFIEKFYGNDPAVKQKFADFYTVPNSLDEQSVKAVDFYNSIKFNYDTAEMLRYHSILHGGSTYQYQFSEDKLMLGIPPPWTKGPAHGDDLLYMFSKKVLFPSMNETQFDAETKNLSTSIIKYWTQFARNGKPDDWEGAVPWKQFDYNKEKSYLDLNATITLKSDLDPINTDFWRNQIPQIVLEQPSEHVTSKGINIFSTYLPVYLLVSLKLTKYIHDVIE